MARSQLSVVRFGALFGAAAAVLLVPASVSAESDAGEAAFETAAELEPADAAAPGLSGASSDEPSDLELFGSVPAEAPADASAAAADAGMLPGGFSVTGAEAGNGALAQDAVPTAPVALVPEPVVASGIVLGPRGLDDQGRAGRLHTVAKGNTLWDLSNAYLGTPWVWPSVWIDNDDIANPHLIVPGDKIWITANEMRVVTDAEAEAFVATAAEMAAAPPVFDDAPVAAFDGADEPSTLEAFPVAVPGMQSQSASSGRRVTVVQREAMGFMSADEYDGASSIVDSPVERTFLAQGDEVVIGVGEGDVEIGDQFMIFQVVEEVRDPQNYRLIGHHVDPLGWLEVRSLTGDTAIAQIRTSYAEIARGVQVVRREPLPASVEVRTTPEVVEGRVVFLPSERTLMADGGHVYINRGEFHGVEVGSELEVYDSGKIVNDRPRRVDVRTPDHIVGKLVVVSVQPDSAVAFVLWSNREVEVGDLVRPRIPALAQR